MSTVVLDDLRALLIPSAAIALGFLLAVSYYKSLCSRDVLVARVLTILARRNLAAAQRRLAAAGAIAIGVPALLVTWTVVLELALLFLGSVDRIGQPATVAVVIVAATRMLAYARAEASHELAKALPLSVAFVVLTGGSLNVADNFGRVVADPSLVDLNATHIAFLVGVELALRVATILTGRFRQIVRTPDSLTADQR